MPRPPPAILAAVVKLEVRENGLGYGSGVCVRWDGRVLILTNKHVASGPAAAVIVHASGRPPRRAAFVAADPAADLSCWEAGQDLDAVDLAPTSTLPAGESFWQVGYPGGDKQRAQYFLLTARRADNLTFGKTVLGGESGGGVFLRGKLVAVVWGASHTGMNAKTWTHTEALPVECCHRLLGRLPPRPRPQVPPNPGPQVPTPPAQAPAPPGKDGRDGKDGADGKPGLTGPAGPPGAPADNAALLARIALLETQLAALRGVAPNPPGPVRVRVEPSTPR